MKAMVNKKMPTKLAAMTAGMALALLLAGSMPMNVVGQDMPEDAATVVADAAVPVTDQVAGAEAGVDAAAQTAAPAGSRKYSLTLKELGAYYPMNLRGVDGSNNVPFNIRDDEVVTAATLHLRYAYSPSLIPELSHINVLVNDELATTIAVSKEDAGRSLEYAAELPIWLMGSFNKLRLQLIGHYTMECEDPMHSSLWANISNESRLELTVAPIAVVNDLGLLPQPFFDRRDVRELRLPFVFAAKPDIVALEAAGVLSSWFGSLSDYRPASFPSNSAGEIPAEGNAVVFATGEAASAHLPGRTLAGATVAVTPNPNDANGKLLLVLGRNPAELKLAAQAIALGSPALSGDVATITRLDVSKPRRPYDAPRWLRSDRPVKFGELAEENVFTVSGYTPDLIRVNLRTPPDLFGWRDKGVPINLKYRYTPRPTDGNSTLTVSTDSQFVRAFPLLSFKRLESSGMLKKLASADEPASVDTHMRVPLYRVAGNSQLQFQFMYEYVKEGECRDVIVDNARSAIDPDSTIDISGYAHYIAMPDLAAFAEAGFPFTRLADLSESAVVIPDSPDDSDISILLALLGRMGQSTGYPATAVTITDAAGVQNAGDKDLLVIDAGGRQPLVKQWQKFMPAVSDGGSRRFAISDLPGRVASWFSPDSREDVADRFAEAGVDAAGASGVFTGFESPLHGKRSVVVVSSGGGEQWGDVLDALNQRADKIKGTIRGSLAVVHGGSVISLVEEHGYYVGDLGWFTWLRWYLSSRPILMALLGLLSIAVLASLIYLLLRTRARRRLAITGGQG